MTLKKSNSLQSHHGLPAR